MMLPIALSVIEVVSPGQAKDDADNPFAIAMLLGIAYAGSIGGVGTIIGTPPNLLLASFLAEKYQTEISFVGWLGIGLPIVAVFLPLTWLWLTRVCYPVGREEMPAAKETTQAIYDGLGPMSSKSSGPMEVTRGARTSPAIPTRANIFPIGTITSAA